MSTAPFFSILIPTRNRSHLVGYAIKSILAQQFEDFEIIVSDNSNDDDSTKKIVNSINDPRLKYVKAENLSMPDNWEFCLAHAKGQFVTVLEDKQAMYPHALKTVYDLICKKDGCEAVGWLSDRLDDTLVPAKLRRRQFSGQLIEWRSEDLIRAFMLDAPGVLKTLPRMINSCVSMRCIRDIQKKSGMQRFFIDISPDICAAFMQLAVLDKYFFIDSPLNVIGGISISNGVQGQRDRNKMRDFLSVNYTDACEFVPIKGPCLAFNMITNDYYRCRKNIGGKLSNWKPDPGCYARWVLHDIGYQYGWGIDVRPELKMWKNYIDSLEYNIRLKLWVFFLLTWGRAELTKMMSSNVKSFMLRHVLKEHIEVGYENVERVVRSRHLIVTPKI